MIWKNCGEDDTCYHNLVESFSGLGTKVKPLQLQPIIELVVKTQHSKVKVDEIELLTALCFDNYFDSTDEDIERLNQNLALEFFWSLITSDTADE